MNHSACVYAPAPTEKYTGENWLSQRVEEAGESLISLLISKGTIYGNVTDEYIRDYLGADTARRGS